MRDDNVRHKTFFLEFEQAICHSLAVQYALLHRSQIMMGFRGWRAARGVDEGIGNIRMLGGMRLANGHHVVLRVGGQMPCQVPELPRKILMDKQNLHLHCVLLNNVCAGKPSCDFLAHKKVALNPKTKRRHFTYLLPSFNYVYCQFAASTGARLAW